MDFGSVSHRSGSVDCYAINDSELVINLRTGKDVTQVSIIHSDPFAGGSMGFRPWDGHEEAMTIRWELKYHYIWTIRLWPTHKREQYYFSLSDGKETYLFFEDGFYTPEEGLKHGRLRQYFKFPWLNAADVITPPQWVNDTVWYQIMPDRFRRGDMGKKRYALCPWEDPGEIHSWDFFGGDLKGITEKLPWLADLGITGIYMTPILLSNTNHKYNTFDYETIDPDFGTEEDMIALVKTAHGLGMKVMVDAVFNHCGQEFYPWTDVMDKGPESKYWDWFFINQWPIPKLSPSTSDGKFYSFAYTAMMPKLNTNNPQVMWFCIRRCHRWLDVWNVDGIRFDVGNEVSHAFLKTLHKSLKAYKEDVFLLGEIWHDSTPWLLGDEYDSVMNYPFLETLHNFWLDNQTSRELQYGLSRCFTMYPQQINNALFNFLDTHDTMRVRTRCGSEDAFFQQLALLMTMPGSACIYYGTEIGLPGGDDPDCRRPMPWHRIDKGEYDACLEQVRSLIALRRRYPQLRRGEIYWQHTEGSPRLVCYRRRLRGEKEQITLWLNAGDKAVDAPARRVLYARKWDRGQLAPGGILISID